MWRLLALLLALPAAAQTVTIDLGALDGVRRARPHLSVQLPALLRVDAPSPLPLPAEPILTPRPSPVAQALLVRVPSSTSAVLALPLREPPRPIVARAPAIELARFVPVRPTRLAPFPPARIDAAEPPMLDVARILLPFAPALDAPQPRDPIVLREAMTPVLAAFPVFERVQNLSLDLPKLTVASSLQFAPASASLDDASRTTLDSIAEQLEDSKSRQVRLLVSLRSGDDPDAARRLALARMLVVRAYLLSRGIAASRLDARATVAAGNDEVARIALLD